MKTRDTVLQDIAREREAWQGLLDEIGEERMEEPGPMGAWTFKDLAAHLTFWQDWMIAQFEAGPGGTAPPPWPASLGAEDEIEDWDAVNAWNYEQHRDRPLGEVLADADRCFERLAGLIAAMPEDDLMTPGRFSIMRGRPLVDANFFNHFHDEHEPSVRAWLTSR